MNLISTSIYTDGQAGRIEIKIAKLEWQALDAKAMVVRGKALLVRLDQPGVGATTFERLGNNQNQNIFQDIIVICICQRLLADFDTKEKQL